jgi:hypothetical protein
VFPILRQEKTRILVDGNITNTAVGQPIQALLWLGGRRYIPECRRSFQTRYAGCSNLSRLIIKFKDFLDGNGVINDNDRQFLGSFIPKASYALNLGANYRNLDFSVFFQGVSGNKIL